MSATNKRILIFSTAYLPFVGGAEIAVKEITDRLGVTGNGSTGNSRENGTGYEFEMITLNLDGKQKSEERIGSVFVQRLGGGGYFYKLLYPFAALYLARRRHRISAFAATWSIMASFSGFAALFFKVSYPNVSFVLTLQEGDPLSRPQRRAAIVWPLFWQIFRQADSIQVISKYLADFAKRMGAKAPIKVIPNGVDLKNFSAPVSNEEKKVIRNELPAVTTYLVTVSRLVEKNGVKDIIDALRLLPTSVGLIIVGTGKLEKKLKDQAASLSLTKRIFFVGSVAYKNVPKWLAAGDIFIRPSLSEGMGNAFIEAMAVGVPVIGTPVGGIVDFLRDGETGVFCQPHNPSSIAEAVKKLLADPTLRQKVIEHGKKLAMSYDWNIVAKRIDEDVFQKI